MPKGKEQRDVAIKTELAKLEKLLLNFDNAYAATMHQSMKSFKEQVSSAHFNVPEGFMFPVPVKVDLLTKAVYILVRLAV